MKNSIFINIKEYVAKRKSEIAGRVAKMLQTPQIAIIQVGDLEASNRYVRNKIKDCDEVGIKTIHTKLPEKTSASTLQNVIDDFNNGQIQKIANFTQQYLTTNEKLAHIVFTTIIKIAEESNYLENAENTR